MARETNRLTTKKVAALAEPGYYSDGGGLYLQISRSATKSWIFRYMLRGRSREMGLGPVHTIGLSDARHKAIDCRKLLLNGTDPIEARNAGRVQLARAAANSITFDEAKQRYIGLNRPTWKNAKHIAQWENTLTTYASPLIAHLPVAEVDTALVLRVLEPIWITKHRRQAAYPTD